MKRNKQKLKVKINKLLLISPQDIALKHNVSKKYYHNYDFDTFIKELSVKDDAIIVRTKKIKDILNESFHYNFARYLNLLEHAKSIFSLNSRELYPKNFDG